MSTMQEYGDYKRNNPLRKEIIEKLDEVASKEKKIGLHKRPSFMNTGLKGTWITQEIKKTKGSGFIRSGKHALGKLTSEQHQLMKMVKRHHKQDKAE